MPSTSIDLTVDVTQAAGLDEPCQTVVTVHLPEPADLTDPPVVCFAFPGGGYARKYYSFDMPGSSGGGEAGWHTSRGWIVVECDHLGVGDSTIPAGELTYETIAKANATTVETVLAELAAGTLSPGFPAVTDPVKLALGQSMGGNFLLVLQAHHDLFDGIGILGFSGIHTVVPTRAGTALPMPWIPRGSDLANPVVLNGPMLAAAAPVASTDDIERAAESGEHPFAWPFHFDDEPADVVALDLAGDPASAPWRSATTPACAILGISPGIVAAEVASIRVPVLIAVGERDVVPDPWMEPKAYKSATDITVYVCPRMAHMHNFASTREQFWARIHHWGTGVAELRNAG